MAKLTASVLRFCRPYPGLVTDAKAEGPELLAPAFYTTVSRGWRRDWLAVLHPPYTAWNLAYVVIGACLAPHVDMVRLVATMLAFLLALGISAHVLDELHSRPLGTQIPRSVLIGAAVCGLVGALALGVVGVVDYVGPGLVVFMAIGTFFVLVYNLELFGGWFHNRFWLASSWGGFTILTSYFAQTGRLSAGALLGAVAGSLLISVQYELSTPVRLVRRRAVSVGGTIALRDGSEIKLDAPVLLAPLERALKGLALTAIALAAALLVARLSL